MSDVKKTYAEINKASEYLNFEPKTSIIDGVQKFVEWYIQYYER